MKKLLSLLCALVMALSMISMNIFAAEGLAEIVAVSSPVRSGEEVTVSFSVRSNPGFSGLSLNLDYDSSKLEFVSAQKAVDGIVPESASFQTVDPKNLDGSKKRVVLQLLNWNGDLNEDGTLWTATFRTTSGFSGSSTIGMELDVDNTFNADLDDVAFVLHDHAVTEAASPMDLNLLKTAVRKSEDLQQADFSRGMDALQTALERARDVLNIPESQERVNAAAREVSSALLYLRKTPNPEALDAIG